MLKGVFLKPMARCESRQVEKSIIFKRSLFIVKDIIAGDVISEQNLKSLRVNCIF